MSLANIDWRGLSVMSAPDLVPAIFEIMQEVALAINSEEPDDPQVLQVIPRLADIIPNRPELSSLLEPFSSLARATGLWNYIDQKNADFSDRVVAEAVTAPELGGITFHREH
jgi:hypothetical protein